MFLDSSLKKLVQSVTEIIDYCCGRQYGHQIQAACKNHFAPEMTERLQSPETSCDCKKKNLENYLEVL